jgi:hypothetical protein
MFASRSKEMSDDIGRAIESFLRIKLFLNNPKSFLTQYVLSVFQTIHRSPESRTVIDSKSIDRVRLSLDGQNSKTLLEERILVCLWRVWFVSLKEKLSEPRDQEIRQKSVLGKTVHVASYIPILEHL